MADKNTITIYTDGACRGNPGPGGWGVVLTANGHEKTLKGFEPCLLYTSDAADE